MHRKGIFIGICVCMALFAVSAPAQEPQEETPTMSLFSPPPDLLDNTPADFPRFHFKGREETAQWAGRYMWYHFHKRLGFGTTLFNQEYVAVSDMWAGGAVHPVRPDKAQDIHREMLLAIETSPDGYVNTHQHFSHSHEQGWPFPLWTQAASGPEGYAIGWHFQDNVKGILGQFLPEGSPHKGERALDGWELENAESSGIVDDKWRVSATGPSPSLVTPTQYRIDAFNAPFLQIRMNGMQPGAVPYVEWMREEDDAFSPERRVAFDPATGNPGYEEQSGTKHMMAEMHTHPLWNGFIKQMRICLAPGVDEGTFDIDSFFTVHDTRHNINNPIYIMASAIYFNWTGDTAFLREMMPRLRKAHRYMQTEFKTLERNLVNMTWSGHDGRSGLEIGPDGSKTIHYGRGIGNNYWDLMPFGGDDMYATSYYHKATRDLADLEEAAAVNPGWEIPVDDALDPAFLRSHADAVKAEANEHFWNADAGRFFAAIDVDGVPHDYGYTFLNLEAIWYGLANDSRAQEIMDWIDGRRIVEGDTSQGADIYHWRFGPRSTTLRNIEYYTFPWHAPESIPWGGQVQDGGAVLGFTFFDLWARLKVQGPDDAWKRLQEILAWEKEVWAEGGYREYYKDGKRGTTLQGGGTAGGLGIDFEFYESSMPPAIVPLGFLGLRPVANRLHIEPALPEACPEMGMSNLLYRGTLMDVLATEDTVTLAVKKTPEAPFTVAFTSERTEQETGNRAREHTIEKAGVHTFER
jgi:hypothetical protein